VSDSEEVAPGLRVHFDEGVHTWWLSHEARRNAVSPSALRWIAERCPTLTNEIVVLRGQGERAFCAGFDLQALAEPSPRGTMPDASLIAATTAMLEADATFIAVLDGYAIGAGVELACACDLRMARRGIFFAVPAAELGVVYHARGLASIRAAFGPAATRRLLLLGERLDADEAWECGALIRLVDDSAALEDALEDVLARLRRSAPLALAGNRELLRKLDMGPPSEAAVSEHDERRRAAYASKDHREARRARAEGRPPRFVGR